MYLPRNLFKFFPFDILKFCLHLEVLDLSANLLGTETSFVSESVRLVRFWKKMNKTNSWVSNVLDCFKKIAVKQCINLFEITGGESL